MSGTRSVILALDQGTTSSRAVVIDATGAILGSAQREFRQLYPAPGLVEHDPRDIWSTQLDTAREALAKAGRTAAEVAGLGIANQRETTLMWDRRTGDPVYQAIVWQDRRTAEYCEGLVRAGHAAAVQAKTGLVIDAYFSASKIRWILDHVPGARERARRGQLAFGTVDTWLAWNLTGGRLHVTDPGNASRTLLYNLHTGDWDDDLLRRFDVPRELLPEIEASSEILGETDPALLGAPVPIAGIAGDQQAALFGQGCFERGLAKNTYGTGCFMLMNIGRESLPSRNRLLTTVAWRTPDGTDFALEGSVFIGGAVVQWLRDGLGIIRSSAEVEPLAASVSDAGGVVLVPAFAGLGAPHWDAYARGTIVGLTRGTGAAHIARAALEGIAFQSADVLDAMTADSGIPIAELRVDGGASANDLLMQFQADILQTPVVRPSILEATAMGAARLAGLATGVWKDRSAFAAARDAGRVFHPSMTAAEAADRRARWAEALRRARDWERHEP